MIMKSRIITPAQTPEELLQDLRDVVSEAEKMLTASAHGFSSKAVGAMRTKLENAQTRLADFYEGTKGKVVAGAKYTDQAIRTHPYQSIAVALGVGLLVGVVLGRRNH
jgi:ElaB/YqjD/DUF883 family membrane-anchored ribosome-binding protein